MGLFVRRQREVLRWLRSLTINRLRADDPGPRILANSIPKSGTHLLKRCLELCPGITDSGLRIRRHPIHLEALEKQLNRVGGGCYIPLHLPFTAERARLLADLGFVMVLIVRDPRDIVVSGVHYVTYKSRRHHLHSHFRELADDSARLMTIICGMDASENEIGFQREDIGTRCRSFVTWQAHGGHLVRFEDLVGPQGGGQRAVQEREIRRLAEHLGLELTGRQLQQIADNVYFRESSTFRKGVIGDWQNHFGPEHKVAFKEVAGQVLIEWGYEQDDDW